MQKLPVKVELSFDEGAKKQPGSKVPPCRKQQEAAEQETRHRETSSRKK
jgi:hypothetical protein